VESQKSKVKSQKSKVQATEHRSVAKGRRTTDYWLLTTDYSGFTLLEVLVAMAVLAVALVSLLGLYNRSLILTIRAQQLSTGMLLAQEMLTRTQLAGAAASRVTAGDFSDFHPGRYPEFRWQRTIRPTPLKDLWEIRVGVAWGTRVDESCELTLFTPLEDS
jgi:general secretion pathway protein I